MNGNNNTDMSASSVHGFEVKNRSSLKVTGVIEILAFDENSITLSTVGGDMAIEGSELKINRMSVDSGELCANGEFDAVYYYKSGKSGKNGIFSRLFR